MNRLSNHEKLVPMTPRCSCGSCEFEQKELRKTGVVVKNARVFYNNAPPTSDVGFVCVQCGKLVPRKDAARIVQIPGFKSLFRNNTQRLN
jgi:hypothetical protein